MKFINIVVEGTSEEVFVNDVLVKHFAPLGIFISARKIKTGWDKVNNKPAKGGISTYAKFKNEVLRWIVADRGRANTFYTSFVDLYAFPKDSQSPYTKELQAIINPYEKVEALESAIAADINHPNFTPYIQLHEFEAFLLASPDRLLGMYPDAQAAIDRLEKEIDSMPPEEINESPQTAPSKRIIRYIPDYEDQKAQVGPMVAEDIGLTLLREKCPHFGRWMTTLEAI